MSTATKREQQEALAHLSEIEKPGDRIHGIVRSVAKSGMIDRFRHPPVDAILRIEGTDLALAKRLFDVLSGAVDPCEASAKCAAWVRQCYHEPSEHEQILCVCDDLLGGCGVEALAIEGEEHTDCGARHCPPFSYVNFGDPYVTTLARDHEAGAWVIAGWGDLVEEYEREHKVGSYAEYDEEPERCHDCHGSAFTFEEDSGEHGAWICNSCNSYHFAAEGAASEEDDDGEE